MVPASAAVGILDAVRNALLEWALKLEKSGVRGEGMSFSADDRKKAHETHATYNIGTIQTFTGNMGSGSGNFSVDGNTINADAKAAILELARQIRENEGGLALSKVKRKELDVVLSGLNDEMGSPQPSSTKVQGFLASIRTIAEGAVGSLAAQGILYELSKLMS
jgi:hypothetical protein